MAKKMNHLENKNQRLSNSSSNISTENKVTALINFKTVSATEFFEKILEILKKGDHISVKDVKNNLETKSNFSIIL